MVVPFLHSCCFGAQLSSTQVSREIFHQHLLRHVCEPRLSQVKYTSCMSVSIWEELQHTRKISTLLWIRILCYSILPTSTKVFWLSKNKIWSFRKKAVLLKAAMLDPMKARSDPSWVSRLAGQCLSSMIYSLAIIPQESDYNVSSSEIHEPLGCTLFDNSTTYTTAKGVWQPQSSI